MTVYLFIKIVCNDALGSERGEGKRGRWQLINPIDRDGWACREGWKWARAPLRKRQMTMQLRWYIQPCVSLPDNFSQSLHSHTLVCWAPGICWAIIARGLKDSVKWHSAATTTSAQRTSPREWEKRDSTNLTFPMKMNSIPNGRELWMERAKMINDSQSEWLILDECKLSMCLGHSARSTFDAIGQRTTTTTTDNWELIPTATHSQLHSRLQLHRLG